MIKKSLALLLSLLMFSSSVVFANATTEETEKPSTVNPYAAAAHEIDEKYGYDGDDLGATYSPENTTFKVWAPTATEVKLNLFSTGSDSEEGAANLGNYIMEKEFSEADNPNSFTGIWKITVYGNLENVFYTYTVTAYNTTGEKITTIETQDIYSVATGVNSKRSMVCNLDRTDPEGWENDTHVLLDKSTESVVWEVHVKDFTYSETSGVSEANRGKYLGFTERGTTLNGEGNLSTCIDYLKEIGVTTVQILPFYDYGSVNEEGSNDQFNWGYDPMNYNVPEGSYSSNPYDGNVRIRECKEMIKALHDAGISVVMDVVYNHTYSISSAFEAIVPNYYYRMKANGSYSNGSGCGNETASERRMFSNFIVQSCKYWVEEYHIDGFRFDLMGILDVDTMNRVRAELDEIDPRLTIWGEGWTGGGCTYDDVTWENKPVYGATQANAKLVDAEIGFFNDGIRDGIRGKALNKEDPGWATGTGTFRSEVRNGITANTRGGKWTAQAPSQCVSYVSCHDNTTLWDKLCDANGITEYGKRKELIVKQNKLTAGLLLMSQGVCFIHAGEEMARTKLGDHNSYSSSADINKINWEWRVANADIVSYYKGLLDIRRNFDTITDNTIESSYRYIPKKKTAFDTISFVIENDTDGQWKRMALLANNTEEPIEFALSDTNSQWVIIANDKTAGLKNLGEVYDNNFMIPAFGVLIAVDKESFETVNLQSNTGTLVVEHMDSATHQVLDTVTVTGDVDSYYETMQTSSTEMIHKLEKVEGNISGKFTTEPQKVTYYYDYIVPESMNIDPNGDGKFNINDVTLLQKGLVQMTELTDEQQTMGNCNYDKQFDINDITMMQKHLVGKPVSVGNVVVNYYKTDTDEKICSSVTYTDIIGTKYEAEPTSALGYVLNKELMPEEQTVTVSYGVTKEINYYYDFVGDEVTIHVKHSGNELTWAPMLWIWGQKNGSDSGNNYCKVPVWPGDLLTKEDDETWYTTGFKADSQDNGYCIVVTDGDSGQSPDCKGFTQLELWCVIDDVKSKSSVALEFYDVNPDENPDALPIYISK